MLFLPGESSRAVSASLRRLISSEPRGSIYDIFLTHWLQPLSIFFATRNLSLYTRWTYHSNGNASLMCDSFCNLFYIERRTYNSLRALFQTGKLSKKLKKKADVTSPLEKRSVYVVLSNTKLNFNFNFARVHTRDVYIHTPFDFLARYHSECFL